MGTYAVETGELVAPQSGLDSNGNGDSEDRTIVNPAGQLKIGRSVTALKNTAGAPFFKLTNYRCKHRYQPPMSGFPATVFVTSASSVGTARYARKTGPVCELSVSM